MVMRKGRPIPDAEQGRVESEKRYTILFQGSADPLLIMKRKFIDCNEEACRYWGYSREEIIGRSPVVFSPEYQPDGRKSADVAAGYLKTALKGTPLSFYWQHLHRSGKLLDTEVRLRKVDIEGEPLLIASVRDISERLKAEEIIRQGRDWYRALAEDIPVLVTRISPEGKITYVNEASRLLIDKPLTEIVGQDFYALVPSEYRSAVEKEFKSLTPEGPVVSYEHFIKGRLFRWKNRAVFNPDRTIKEYFTVGEDITDQHQADESMRHQLQFEMMLAKVSSLFVNSPSEMIDNTINQALKLAGEFFSADRIYLMRFTADQQHIVNPYEWCAPGVSSVQERNQCLPVSATPWWANQILNKSVVHVPDIDLLPTEAAKDKEDFRIEEVKSLITIPMIRSGDVFAFFGIDAVKTKKSWTEQQIALIKVVGEIISESLAKAEAEEALKDSEERYREILATIEEGYYEADLSGVITFCNDAAGRLFGGYSQEELIGMSYKNLYKYPELAYTSFNRVFMTGVPEKGLILEMTRKDKSTVFGELSISLVKDKEGYITGFKGIGKDVTERIEYEKRLEYLSLHDQLTGIHNRAYFESELEHLEGGREYPVTIITADLDGLKLINDTLGHDTGDQMLRRCAEILKGSLRQSDLLARIGGDEFSAVLRRTDRATGELVMRRIREKVNLINQDDANIPLGLSIGVATADDSNTALKEAYIQADDSMYRDKLYRSNSSRGKIVQSLLAALAERDYITEGHARRLEDLCRTVGEKIDLSSHQLTDLALLAQVHDLGKVGIPDYILYKPGPLNEEEWEVMRGHPEKGYRIAVASPDLAGVADLILKHHERWDGSGYPLGLKEKEIPVECRIISIIDAYDAMTNKRPYSKVKSREEALAEIKRGSGSQFDPDLVAIFLSVINEA